MTPPTILTILDDPLVMRVCKRLLTREGFRVIAARSCVEARARFAEHRSELQAICCDLGLPDDNGLNLVAELREHSPELPVLIVSGAASSPAMRHIRERGYFFLAKPFSITSFREVLNSLVPDRARPARRRLNAAG